MVDRLPIVIPIGIHGPHEDLGNTVPVPPRSRIRGNQSRPGAASHRDRDLCALLDAANQIRSVLTQFTQADDLHSATVAHVLHVMVGLQFLLAVTDLAVTDNDALAAEGQDRLPAIS